MANSIPRVDGKAKEDDETLQEDNEFVASGKENITRKESKDWRWTKSLKVSIVVLLLLFALPVAIWMSTRPVCKLPADTQETAIENQIDGGKITTQADWIGRQWPEVVGLTGQEASAIILRDTNNGVTIHIIPSGSMMTMDYDERRVRIIVDGGGYVSVPPRVG